MALKVTVPNSSQRVTATVSDNRVVTQTIRNTSRTQSATTLDNLEGVDVSDAEDGYALVFNEDNGQWEAAPTSSLAVAVDNIDGGTY
jgi:hypothetical protein